MAQRGHNIDPTARDIGQKEQRTRQFLENQFLTEKQSEVNGPNDVHVRDMNPGLDLDKGADNTTAEASMDSKWEQTGLTDGANTVYEIDSDNRADNKIFGIVAVTLRGASNVVEVRFQSSPGGIFERLNVQGAYTDEEATVLLANPVVYGLDDDGSIVFEIDGSGDEEVQLHGYVAEKAGNELAKVPQQFITPNRAGGRGN